MAVLLETSRGDIVIDLFAEECPITCKNFVKLCKAKYYNNCIFHYVQRNFLVQTGDPTGTGKGGTSIYGLMYGDQARFFDDEKRPLLRHKVRGVVGMASPVANANASQFYITTGEDLDSLDGKHTIFGKVGEGFDTLDKINEAFVDEAGRPLQNIRIRHTIVLEDPFPDPPELESLIPPESPEPQFEQGDRLEDDWVPTEDTRDIEQIEEEARKADAHNRAVVLEMIGDLPEADVKPPSNVLFICKLNPVTTEEDLEIIFSRFGKVVDCAIIRDWKTGDSLCYGFIGFDNEKSCEEAYFKMNNVLVDDRRIRVDFSQSVSHLWKQFKKGGRKGDASMKQEADTHQRAPAGERLEYKGQQLGGHGPAGRGSGRGGGPQHQLLVEEDDAPHAAPQHHQARQAGPPAREPQPDHVRTGGGRRQGGGERRGEQGRERDRDGDERGAQDSRRTDGARRDDRDRERQRDRAFDEGDGARRGPDRERDEQARGQRERHRGDGRDRMDGKHDSSSRTEQQQRDGGRRSERQYDHADREHDRHERRHASDRSPQRGEQGGRHRRDDGRGGREEHRGGGRSERRDEPNGGRERERDRGRERSRSRERSRERRPQRD